MSGSPDQPTTMARFTGEGFVGELQGRVSRLTEAAWDELKGVIQRNAGAIQERNGHRIVDGPSQLWLAFCSTVLGAYRTLLPQVKDSRKLMDAISAAMTEGFREGIEGYLVERFGITQDRPELAFEKICQNFKRLGDQRFGRSFHYAQDRLDHTHCFVNISKCFFDDFFRANNAPELIPAFCVMDDLWADELKKPQYGVRFERPTTLAQGGDACRFQFYKSGP